MDEILKKLESLKSATALKDNERNKIDSVVTSFMDSYESKKEESSKLNFMQLFSLNWTRKLAVSLASLFVVSSAGVVYASSMALPGDALYGLKLGLENIQGWSKLSDQSKADFAIDKIQTRLDEIRKLNSLRGEVSAEALALIQEKISEYSNDISMATEILKNNKDGGRMAEITEKLQMITAEDMEDVKFNALLETIAKTEAGSKQAQFQMSSDIVKEVSSQPLTTTQGGLKIYQPQAGDVITQSNGSMYYMDWASIENAQYYEVSLLNENGVNMGIIFVESLSSQQSYNYLSTDMMWDGRMIFDSNGNYSGNKIKTGNYKIKVVAKNWNGNITWGNSETFSIVEGTGLIEMVGTAQELPVGQSTTLTPEAVLKAISLKFSKPYNLHNAIFDWSMESSNVDLKGDAITLQDVTAAELQKYFIANGFVEVSVADGSIGGLGHSITDYSKGEIGCRVDEISNGDVELSCAYLTTIVTNFGQETSDEQPTQSEELTLYTNDNCSHCANVKAYIEKNDISNIKLKDISTYEKEFYDAGAKFGIPSGNLGVPFMVAGNEYFYGDERIIEYLGSIDNQLPLIISATFDGNGVIIKGENLAGSYISFVNTSAGILCREMITPNCVLEKTTSTDTTIEFISNWIGSPGTYQVYMENPTTGESNKVDFYIKPVVK